MHYIIKKVWGREKGSMWEIVNTLKSEQEEFINMDLLGVFVDNHDMPRFLSEYQDLQSFKAALILSLTIRGIPFVYYGSEHAYSGGADPFNRELMWQADLQNTNSDIYLMLQKVNEVRKSHKIWDQPEVFHLVRDDFLALSRGEILVALTNQRTNIILDISGLNQFRENERICNIFANPVENDCLHVKNGKVTVALFGGESKIYTKHSENDTLAAKYEIWVRYVIISIGFYVVGRHAKS